MFQQGIDKRREKNYGGLKWEYGRSPEKVTEERRRTVFENNKKEITVMKKVVIAGGGWSGCAAAVEARKLGAEVTLL